MSSEARIAFARSTMLTGRLALVGSEGVLAKEMALGGTKALMEAGTVKEEQKDVFEDGFFEVGFFSLRSILLIATSGIDVLVYGKQLQQRRGCRCVPNSDDYCCNTAWKNERTIEQNGLLNSPTVCAVFQHWIRITTGSFDGRSFALSNALGGTGRYGRRHCRNRSQTMVSRVDE
jgi:hypothetical protein